MLGRVLVEQGLCTREEIDDCLAIKSELDSTTASENTETQPRSLADLLITNGCLTKSQLQRVQNQVDESTNFQQIPGYQILSKLGAGAMATVYKARQLSLDRIVAIKVLPPATSKDPEFVDRFYKEGKAAAKLNHPNIVGAVDVGEANGRHYFVMEYVEGATVFDKLDKGERYEEKDAINLVIQICRALAHAHAAGFIHRDVKPKNIMITPQGVAKLADMGLARETSDIQAAEAEAGKAYGTPYYISPEQIRGELNIDAGADIYSLGATFYHMVTGRVPFEAASPTAVMHKHLREELVPPDHIVPSLSAGVGEIIEVAMAKKRRNRYATAEDMLTDLERVLQGEPPLVARRAYDLDSLADLENSGTTIDDEGTTNRGAAVSSQHTIDYGERTFKERFSEPLILGLCGALGIALIAIIVLTVMLLARH